MTLYDSCIAGDANEAAIYDVRTEGQTFTPTYSYTITSVQLKLGGTGDAETLTVRIYATGADGLPSGAALCTGTVNANTFVASPGSWIEITLGAGTDLTAATKYAIVCTSDTTDNDDILWRLDLTGTYTGGNRFYDANGGVDNFDETGTTAHDYMFKCYGTRISSGSPVDKSYSKRLVAVCNGEVWYESVENGTATGGTATTLLDSTRTEADDYFIDWILRIVSGTGIGETATVTAYTEVGGIFGFAALSGGSTPDATSRYTVDIMSEFAAASGEVDTTDILNMAVSSQKLFIANGSNKKVFDFVNKKLYDADVLTTKPTFGQIIYQAGADPAQMIVDFINGDTSDPPDANYIYGKVISGTFETGTGITTEIAGAGAAIMTPDTVTSPPHWYDWTPYNNDTTTYGTMPDKAYGVCRYRGRVQLCRDPDYPHQWYQSRQLNPFDFLHVPGDAQSPVVGNDADCTEVGDIIVVAIPYSDDYLIYGCASEIWVMSGDAAFSGELNPLDTTTGILGDRAWCWDAEGNLYMAGTAGLLRIPKGFGGIENLTKELWPDFIADLAFDSSLHRITLAFNPEDFGIHIFKTTLTTGVCEGWWYDLRTEGLFPDAIPTAMGIYSAFYYQAEDPAYKKLLFGCADGYIKSFDRAIKNDDGTTITSYVGFAPLALSIHSRKDGIIKNLDLVSGGGASGSTYQTDSNDVTCTVHVARTAEQVLEKLKGGTTAAFTKIFTAPGWNKSNLDRRSVRGQWAAIVLTNEANTESWSMERLMVDSKEAGRSL